MSLKPAHLLLVLAICLVWGLNFVVAAHALTHLPAFLFTALRLSLVLVLLLPWLRLPPVGQWPLLVAVAVCNGALHFGISFWGLAIASDVASVALTLQSYVPMAALLSVWWLGERLGWRSALAIATAFAGVLVVGLDPLVLQQTDALLLTLIGALMLAVGTVLMRRLKGLGAMNVQAWTALLGVPVLLIASALFEPPMTELITAAPTSVWWAITYTALLASIFGHGSLYYLVQRYPVTAITPYLLLSPVLAVLGGMLFWGDRPGLRVLLGGALVLGGILMLQVRARQKARPTPLPGEAP